jgi:hypothetical protein
MVVSPWEPVRTGLTATFSISALDWPMALIG